jgi:hypothetical protein
MDVSDVMRTTFAAREFTDDPIDDAISIAFSTTPASGRAAATGRAAA